LFEEGNPVGIKALLELSGLCSKQVRLPLISATSTLFDRMEQVIEQSIYAY
jgi:4-hydroxy-tetrahydrodipicolinate synthase